MNPRVMMERVTKRGAGPRRSRIVAGLLVCVLISAVGVVYAKHQSRKLFVELQALQKGRDDLDIEWGQLQLEQSTWATHGRVEGIAGAKLGMEIPEPNQVVVLKP
ncbi:MAG: cell division protein FtsL [Pseudomonadota bacterium]